MTTDVPGSLTERLLAYLDDGVSPVTAGEARARASNPAQRPSARRNPRRTSLVLPVGFALLLAIGVIAAVSVFGGSHGAGTHNASPVGPEQMEIAYLLPDGHATAEQLHRASAVLVDRLKLLGESSARAKVSNNRIVLTVNGSVQRFRSTFPRILETGDFFFRPVLCAAPAYNREASRASAPRPLPTECPTQYELTATNLDVNTSAGTPQDDVPPWPALASFSSTTEGNDDASEPVLLQAGPNSGFGGERLLLGPAQVSGLDVSSAQVAFFSPEFGVDINLSPLGAKKWDSLAEQQFHTYIAFDLDGTLISVPLIEPTQETFASFGGKAQISGGFSKTTAQNLAVYLESGPLTVALRAESVETVRSRLPAQ